MNLTIFVLDARKTNFLWLNNSWNSIVNEVQVCRLMKMYQRVYYLVLEQAETLVGLFQNQIKFSWENMQVSLY